MNTSTDEELMTIITLLMERIKNDNGDILVNAFTAQELANNRCSEGYRIYVNSINLEIKYIYTRSCYASNTIIITKDMEKRTFYMSNNETEFFSFRELLKNVCENNDKKREINFLKNIQKLLAQ
ncbi:MAG: hypothetical protein ACLTMR_14015 [Faecalibacillus sp.]